MEEHAVFKLREKIRKTLLAEGFKEVMHSPYVEAAEVKKQYGPEASVILDRIYFLAGLPRPDIGLSDKNLAKIKKIIPKFSKTKELTAILRRYRAGEIEGDNFTEVLVKELRISPEQATKLIDEIFAEFKELRPLASTLTLRSHITANWFQMLSKVQDRIDLPAKFFTIDRVFRREQKLDSTHLRSSHNASIVVMDRKIDGKKIAMKIFKALDLKDIKFVKKSAHSNYYEAKTEEEVFARIKGKWIEIANSGYYSKDALNRYGIKYRVYNLGFGVERTAMVLTGVKDIRELAYPEIYSKEIKNISSKINLIKSAQTAEGKKLVKKIIEIATEHKDDRSPCRVKVFEGKFNKKKVKVEIIEPEENKKLLGPAALNDFYGIKLIEALANEFVYELEKKKKGQVKVRAGMINRPAEINIKVPQSLRKWLEDQGKAIQVKGPVFTTIIS